MNAQTLIAMGFVGKRVGAILKQSKSWSEEQTQEFLKTGETPVFDSVKMIPGSVWDWACNNVCLQNMFSIETGNTFASNAEKRRWFDSGIVLVNGTRPKPDDKLSDELKELVWFPGSSRQITML